MFPSHRSMFFREPKKMNKIAAHTHTHWWRWNANQFVLCRGLLSEMCARAIFIVFKLFAINSSIATLFPSHLLPLRLCRSFDWIIEFMDYCKYCCDDDSCPTHYAIGFIIDINWIAFVHVWHACLYRLSNNTRIQRIPWWKPTEWQMHVSVILRQWQSKHNHFQLEWRNVCTALLKRQTLSI